MEAQTWIQRGLGGAHAPPIFCNHFEELQTVLIEVELIISNAPLTYVYSNIIETCLTSNHSLFDRELLQHQLQLGA